MTHFRNISDTKNLPILFLLGFIVLVGFWSLNFLIFIFVLLLIFLLKRKKLSYNFSLLDFGIICVFLADVISFIFSEYPPNSLGYFTMSSVILFLYLIYKELFHHSKVLFLNIITFFSFIIATITITFFWNYHSDLNAEGFYALNNFKNLYNPFGFLNNNWVSIFILFIPFQVILILYQKKNRFLTYLNIGITLFCVIVSFSRGAYVGVLAFIILLNLFALKLINKKRLIFINLIFIISISALSLPVQKEFVTTFSYNKLNSQNRSTNGRIFTWKHYVNNNKHAILGWGQGNLSLAIQNNPIHREDIEFSSRVNNTFLKMYIEKGILGISSYVLLIAIIYLIGIINLKRRENSKNQKLEIIIILSGLFSFVVRDLTFSSFSNNYVYFLFFHLIFLLIPYDIKIKEITFKKTGKKVILISSLVFFLLLLFYNTKLLIANNYNNKFISFYQNNNIHEGIETLNKALKLSPNNIILLKHKLVALSENVLDIKITNRNTNLLQFKNVDSDSINQLIHLSKEILKLNGNDDEIKNNIGWFYFSLNKIDSANNYFNKAILLSPYNSYYHISKLLLDLQYSDIDAVKYDLTKALQYSPDIQESIFYKEFSIKYPTIAVQARNNAIENLKKTIENNRSPILEARMANLLMHSNPKKALDLFKKVTHRLPNMNRPWMHRAILFEKLNQNTDSLESYYKHAVYLDPRDYLSKLNLANFYKVKNSDKKSILNYKEALINYNNISSLSYAKNRTISTFKTIRNTSIPLKLTRYIKPDINVLEVFKVIQKHYQDIGDIKGRKYYTDLIRKYNNKTYMGFEKIY